MVLPYLYPDLENGYDKDYYLQNDGDDTGTFLVWLNAEIAEPTEQELADAKEAAVNAYWWKRLREKRDKLLVDSDWSQGADVPSDLKSSYATYRTDLRDLPTTVTKTSFETLNNESNNESVDNGWNMKNFMPTKPTE
jgi:hypothetical protein|tara:strand:+ start:755 stop:1165 length:411 start_codon:yes stop_codon:yes gene_type:complete